MAVYAFRHGQGNHFKIGRTANVQKRLKQLQTGSPQPLTVFDVIDATIPDSKECEEFLHRQLAHKCLIGENFELTPAEVRAAMDEARKFLDELPQRRAEQARLQQLSSMESSDEMLPATAELLDQRRRLLEIRTAKAQRMAEVAELGLEEAHLENAIKLAIGQAMGIEGVALWQSMEGRRRFNPERLKADDPELYETYVAYVPKFESAKFKAADPAKYADYQDVQRVRHFLLLEDPNKIGVQQVE